jgi:hypothetical protein
VYPELRKSCPPSGSSPGSRIGSDSRDEFGELEAGARRVRRAPGFSRRSGAEWTARLLTRACDHGRSRTFHVEDRRGRRDRTDVGARRRARSGGGDPGGRRPGDPFYELLQLRDVASPAPRPVQPLPRLGHRTPGRSLASAGGHHKNGRLNIWLRCAVPRLEAAPDAPLSTRCPRGHDPVFPPGWWCADCRACVFPD